MSTGLYSPSGSAGSADVYDQADVSGTKALYASASAANDQNLKVGTSQPDKTSDQDHQ